MTFISGKTLEFTNYNIIGYPIPSISFQWTRDGIEISGATGNTYKLITDDVFTVIGVSATVSNIFNTETFSFTAGQEILPNENEKPSFIETPIRLTQLNPYPGSTATVQSYGATGELPITTEFNWYVSGITSGFNDDSYYILGENQGNSLSCKITLTNIFGTTSSSVDFGIIDLLPTFIGTPSAVTTPIFVGNTAEVQDYGSTGASPITTEFVWKSSGVTVGGDLDYYVTQESDFGNYITCTIKLENYVGTTSETINFGNVEANWNYNNDGIYRFSTPLDPIYRDLIVVDSSVEFAGINQSSLVDDVYDFRLKSDSIITGKLYAAVWDGSNWSTYESWNSNSTEQRFSDLLGSGGTPSENEIVVLYRNNPGNPSLWSNYK